VGLKRRERFATGEGVVSRARIGGLKVEQRIAPLEAGYEPGLERSGRRTVG